MNIDYCRGVGNGLVALPDTSASVWLGSDTIPFPDEDFFPSTLR